MKIGVFRDFMPHTVTVEPYSGQSAYGESTYGTAVTYPARVEMKSRRLAGLGGVEIAARGRIFLGTTTVPSAKDRITLPASFVPTQPPILDASPVNDESGIHHVVVFIG